MALRTLRFEKDDILRKQSRQVTDITENVKTLIADMKETMEHHSGVGLAAPQVGVLKRIVVLEDEEEVVHVLINPEISNTEGEQSGDEACLSVPGMIATVKRPEKLMVTYLTPDGETLTMDADDKMAIIIAHEVDHLNGILYKDIAEPNTFRENHEEENEKEARRRKKLQKQQQQQQK